MFSGNKVRDIPISEVSPVFRTKRELTTFGKEALQVDGQSAAACGSAARSLAERTGSTDGSADLRTASRAADAARGPRRGASRDHQRGGAEPAAHAHRSRRHRQDAAGARGGRRAGG